VCAVLTAPSICDVLVTCAPCTPLTRPLPRTVECRAPRDVDASMLPTHYLVVYNPHTRQPGQLFPAHSLLLAAQCAAAPRFGPTTRELRADSTFRVPLLGLPVPAPHAFHPLFRYLHGHGTSALLAALLPLPSAALGPLALGADGIQSRLVQLLVDWLSLRALLAALKTCHGVWANAAALHVNDDRLWHVLHYAWCVLVQAVERSAPAAIDADDADAVDRALGEADTLPYEV
jgi:hypothetical protein